MTAANSKAGITLDELGLIVQSAHRLGIDGDAAVRVSIGWRQQIQRITIGDDQ